MNLLNLFSPAAQGVSIARYAFDEARTYSAQVVEANPTLQAASEGIGDFVSNLVETAYSNMEPNAFIDFMVEQNPALEELGEVIKGNNELAGAVQQAMTQDPSMREGFENMVAGEAGAELLETMTARLGDPEVQNTLANALITVADQDDVNFEQFNALTNALVEYDIGDREASGSRIVTALQGVGLTEEQARTRLSAMEASAMNEFSGNFLEALLSGDIELAAGMLGNMLENLGLPPSVTSFISGIIPEIGPALGNIGGMYADMFDEAGYNDLIADYVAPAIDRTQHAGAGHQEVAAAVPTPP